MAFVLVAALAMRSVWAQEPAPSYPDELLEIYPAAVWDELGDERIEQLDEDGLAVLVEACPGPDAEAVLACMESDARAAEVLRAAARRAEPDDGEPIDDDLVGEEPTEGEPDDEPDDEPDADEPDDEPDADEPDDEPAAGEPDDETNAIASILEFMDVELPGRLTPDEYEGLAEACQAPGEAWGSCIATHREEPDACAEAEEVVAACLVGNDLVADHYLEIVAEKKAIFGKEIYVEFAGLMAMLPIETIEGLKQACPQDDRDQAAECFQSNELVSEIIGAFYEASKELVAEAAQEIGAAGKELDHEAYTEAVTTLFLTLPVHAIQTLATACERQHPQLATLQDPSDLDEILGCIQEQAQTDPIANPAYIGVDTLRQWLSIARQKVVATIEAKELDAQSASFDRIMQMLSIFAGLGFIGVLLMPLALGNKYPDQGALLWKSSVVAAITFALTVLALGVSLLAMRTVQSAVATDSTSPKMRIAQGAFDVLEQDEYVEGFSELSKARLDFIKEPLRRIVESTQTDEEAEEAAVFAAYLAGHWAQLLQEPELRHLAHNASTLEAHAATFKSVLALYKKVDWLMGLVPIILSILAVVLYLVPLKDTLVDIASAPARAARGATTSGATVKQAMSTVWAEVKSIVPFIGTIVVLLPFVGFFLAFAVEPLIELLLGYSLVTVFYILSTEASAFVLYASLGSVISLLVACLAVYILTMVFYLGTARKIFRAVFHFGSTWAEFRGFWTRGSLALLWLLVFPVLYVHLMDYVAFELLEPDFEQLGVVEMLAIPLPAFLAFPLLWWATRGLAALKLIKGFPVPKVRTDPSLADAAADLADGM